MGLFNLKKEEAKPYAWKEYDVYGKKITEYRFFRGRRREWGSISVTHDGIVEWEYAHYHPYREFIHLDHTSNADKLPLWFYHLIEKTRRAVTYLEKS